jgi:hypothetical protein
MTGQEKLHKRRRNFLEVYKGHFQKTVFEEAGGSFFVPT